MDRLVRTFSRTLRCGALLLVGGLASAQEAEAILYMEQPTGIGLEEYGARWPTLDGWLKRLAADADAASTVRDRLRDATAKQDEPGALNLLAQLQRQAGATDEALASIERALATEPDEFLHHFQLAMVCHAKLRVAESGLARWQWHNRTKAAYERAFELDPANHASRYYLAYTAQQAPIGMGGDPEEALRLAREGLERGQLGFTVVVADLLRLQGSADAALRAFDLSVERGAFKLNAFVAAVELALERDDVARALAYSEFLVRCRPDSPRSHVARGDALARSGSTDAARAAYSRALELDPMNPAARRRLGETHPKR